MKTVFVLVVAGLMLLVGCSALPSVRYCDEVLYERSGDKITLLAECRASGLMRM